jgi:G3E family GTPase
VLQTFFADPYVQGNLQLDAVLCVCDAVRLGAALAPSPAAAANADSTTASSDSSSTSSSTAAAQGRVILQQLALADKVLLNKTDLTTPEQLAALTSTLASVSPAVTVLPCVRGAVDLKQLLNTSAFSLSKVIEEDEDFLGACFPTKNSAAGAHHSHGEHQHNGDHSHHASASSEKQHNGHAHSELGLQTVGIEVLTGSVDSAKALVWLRTAVSEHSDAIWRIKGVLWCAPTAYKWSPDQRIIVQGLGGHLETEAADWPSGKIRRSRVILIGPFSSELQATLRQGLAQHVAPAAAAVARPQAVVAPASRAATGAAALSAASREPAAAAVVSSFGGAKAAAKRGGRSDFDDFF